MQKIRNLIAFVALLTALGAMAVQARQDLRKVTQPDGTVVTLRLVGDEFAHFYLTDDDQMVLKSADGYCFATVDASGCLAPSKVLAADASRRNARQREFVSSINKKSLAAALSKNRQASPRLKAPARAIAQSGVGLYPNASFQTTGSPKCLIILVDYQDVKFNLGSDAYNYFNSMLNQQGFSQYNATGSVIDFFTDASAGKFTPEFVVKGPVTLANNRAYYGGNDSKGNDLAPHKMVIEACQALDSELNFADFDTDNDGEVDNVFVFYAGEGEASSDVKESVWPHAWYVYDGAGITLLLDGKKINRYGCTNEWGVNSKGQGRPDGIGTFCHEFSHVMGLPDLYVTDYNSEAKTLTPNAYAVMDYGNYNNDGRTPPTYSSFERNAFGWCDVETLQSGVGRSEELEHILTSNKAYVIPTSKSTEFFLLENRQQTGWDKYIPGHGMLVWHIDYNSTIWNANKPNNNATHMYVDIEEACGTADSKSSTTMAGYPFPGTSRKTSFTDDTTPNMKTWDGVSLNTPITNIAETSGVISFDVCGGVSTGGDEPGGDDPVVGDGTYTLVKSTDAIAAGDRIIIVAKDSDYALSTTQNANNRGQAEVTKSGDTITLGSDVEIITLEAASNGYYNLKVGSTGGYLYASSSSKNYLVTSTATTANTPASIGVAADGTATIIFKGSYTRNQIQYNSGSSLFSCYSSSQQPIVIYKENKPTGGGEDPDPQTPDVAAPTFTVNGVVLTDEEATYNEPVSVTISCATEGSTLLIECDELDIMDEFDSPYTFTVDRNAYIEVVASAEGYNDVQIEKMLTFQPLATMITPEPGEYDAMPEISISCATEGVEIRYTLDESVPTAESTLYTAPFTPEGESVTVKARAFRANWLEGETTTVTYTVKEQGGDEPGVDDPVVGDGTFTLVTETSSLKAGDRVIIVNNTAKVALSTTQNNNNRGQADVTIDSTNTITPGDNVQIITLEAADSYFDLNVGNGYLYASSSSSNNMRTAENSSADTHASITIDSNNAAVITFQGQYTRNLIRYNSTNKIFSCYSSGQQPVYIYKENKSTGGGEDPDPQTPDAAAPTFTVNGVVLTDEEATYNEPVSVTISCATEGSTLLIECDELDIMDEFDSPYTFTVDRNAYIEVVASAEGYNDVQIEKMLTFQPLATVITPEPGEYDAMPEISISCATEGVEIRYTLDESVPTAESALYTAPFTPEGESVTVKARAFRANWLEGETTTALYTVKEQGGDEDPEYEDVVATFDFTGDTAYGMTLLSGSNSAYNPDMVECVEADGTKMILNGDTRWWATSTANELRFYSGSSFTIIAPEGFLVTDVEFDAVKSKWDADKGTFDSVKNLWTGREESIVFSTNIEKDNTAVNSVNVTLLAIPTFTMTRTYYEHASDKSVTLVCEIDHSNAVHVNHYEIWVVDMTGPSAESSLMRAESAGKVVGMATVSGDALKSDKIIASVPLTDLAPDTGIHSLVVRAQAVLKDSSNVYSTAYVDGEVEGSTGEYGTLVDTSLTESTTGIDQIGVDRGDEGAVYYNLQGIRVENPVSGVYLRREGSIVTKVVIR